MSTSSNQQEVDPKSSCPSQDTNSRLQPRSVSKSRFGLQQLYPKEEDVIETKATKIDIFALHGLDTDGQITWIHDGIGNSGPVHWLRDKHMLPSSIHKPRILTYDWNSNYDTEASSARFEHQSDVLLKHIHANRQKRGITHPIVFIASCYSGLLLAKALVRADYGCAPEDRSAILQSTRGIVFLGTPFRGSWGFGSSFAEKRLQYSELRMFESSRELTQYLRPTKPNQPTPLDALRDDFESLLLHKRARLKVACFFETRKSKYKSRIKKLPDDVDRSDLDLEGEALVVDETSAHLLGADHIGLDVIHSMLNKHCDPNSPEFTLIAQTLKDFTNHALGKVVRRRSSSEGASRALRHYLDEMPGLCHPYQPQLGIDTAIEALCSSNTSHGEHRNMLLICGLTGRGKTQSVVAYIKEAEKVSSRRLLWLNARSPDALFKGLLDLHKTCIAELPQPCLNTSRSSQPEEIAKIVRAWLSEQKHPWLMVLDHLGVGDRWREDLEFHDMGPMLGLLYNARGGRIIATSSHVPKNWPNHPSVVHHVSPLDEKSGLNLIHAHLPGEALPCSKPAREAALTLLRLLDFHPYSIFIACSTIIGQKISINEYMERRDEVFTKSATATSMSAQTLDISLRRHYEDFKTQHSDGSDLSPVTLLNILVCLGGSRISEAIFRRAWDASSSNNGQPGADVATPQTFTRGLLERAKRWLIWTPRSEVRKSNLSMPEFLMQRSDQTQWKLSDGRRQLRTALQALEEYSFLHFSQGQDGKHCEIKVPRIIQDWICLHYFTPASLDVNLLHEAWWQASSILATSLKPPKRGENRKSTLFLDFQKEAAAHVYHLHNLVDDPESAKLFNSLSEGGNSPWTEKIFLLDQRGEAANLFADALDTYGYSHLATQVRKALAEIASAEGNNFDELAKLLALADSLGEDGSHLQALETREAALGRLSTIQIPHSADKEYSQVPTHVHKLLELMVHNDMADSYWNLGKKRQSSEKFKAVYEGLEIVRKFLEEDYVGAADQLFDLRQLLMQARLGRAMCLVRYHHRYEEAQAMLGPVLEIPKSQNNVHGQRLYLRARAMSAEIMFARGSHSRACQERKAILQERRILDPDMEHLDTMVAQIEYANSVSVFQTSHDSWESLKLRKEVMRQLRQPSSRVSRNHNFFNEALQNLARCYVEVAEGGFDKENHEHEDCRQRYLCKAAGYVQEVWKDRQTRKDWGLIHPETLKTLTLVIRYERLTETFTGDYVVLKPMALSAFRQTSLAIQRHAEQDQETKGAWFQVQLENCLVNDPVKRLKDLIDLYSRLHVEPPVNGSGRTYTWHKAKELLDIRYEIALAQMEPLYTCKNPRERRLVKKKPEFLEAAKELEKLWRQRQQLLHPTHNATLQTLHSAINAFKAINNNRCMYMQAKLCSLLHGCGETGSKFQDAVRELETMQKVRMPELTPEATRLKLKSWEELLG